MEKNKLTSEECDAIARIAVRWHHNSETHTAHQASFDVGYLLGILSRFIELSIKEAPKKDD